MKLLMTSIYWESVQSFLNFCDQFSNKWLVENINALKLPKATFFSRRRKLKTDLEGTQEAVCWSVVGIVIPVFVLKGGSP
jgi:hypothetical protein